MTPGKRNRSPWLYIAAGAVVLAGGYLSFELGRLRAGYALLDQRRDEERYREQLVGEQAAGEELRRRLAILETSHEVDRETYAQIEANLAELQARIQTQEEELVFYRGIVSPQDGTTGLRVQSLEILPSDAERRYLLRLVLVQAIVHSRPVAGTVRLRLEGGLDGERVDLGLDELAVAGPADASRPRSDGGLAYEFRYFQGLETELQLPAGFEPMRIHVEIAPGEPRGERITQSFDWVAVAA